MAFTNFVKEVDPFMELLDQSRCSISLDRWDFVCISIYFVFYVLSKMRKLWIFVFPWETILMLHSNGFFLIGIYHVKEKLPFLFLFYYKAWKDDLEEKIDSFIEFHLMKVYNSCSGLGISDNLFSHELNSLEIILC